MENKRLPKVRRLVNLVRPAVTGLIVTHVMLGSSVRAMTKTVRYATVVLKENIRTQKAKHPVYPAYLGNINVSWEHKNVSNARKDIFQTKQN